MDLTNENPCIERNHLVQNEFHEEIKEKKCNINYEKLSTSCHP